MERTHKRRAPLTIALAVRLVRIAIATAFFLVLCPHPASADWVVVGAAYQCNKPEQTFWLQGTVDTSSPEDKGTIRPKAGFTKLQQPLNTLRCSIGKAQVEAKVKVVGPQARGMCAGIGLLSIELLTANGRKLLEHPEMFNSGCFNEPVLFDVRVQAEGANIKIRFCRGTWDWGVGYADAKCEELVHR